MGKLLLIFCCCSSLYLESQFIKTIRNTTDTHFTMKNNGTTIELPPHSSKLINLKLPDCVEVAEPEIAKDLAEQPFVKVIRTNNHLKAGICFHQRDTAFFIIGPKKHDVELIFLDELPENTNFLNLKIKRKNDGFILESETSGELTQIRNRTSNAFIFQTPGHLTKIKENEIKNTKIPIPSCIPREKMPHPTSPLSLYLAGGNFIDITRFNDALPSGLCINQKTNAIELYGPEESTRIISENIPEEGLKVQITDQDGGYILDKI